MILTRTAFNLFFQCIHSFIPELLAAPIRPNSFDRFHLVKQVEFETNKKIENKIKIHSVPLANALFNQTCVFSLEFASFGLLVRT